MPSALVKEKEAQLLRLVMTQKHAKALPTMKGHGREPRPTAWLSRAALRDTTVARGPQKQASVSLPAALQCLGIKKTAGSKWCGCTVK